MKRIFPSSSPAVALVVTLLMMSILVMMVVGLAGVMRNEQAAARNLTYQVIADQMADLGAREAMAAVLSNSTGSIGKFSATGPGWMFTNGVFVPLFSSNSAGQMKNLEQIGTNSLVFSLPAGVRGRIMAAWTNVLAPGSSVALGRHAWWIDDEGTKVNLNATGTNNINPYLPLLTNFPISVDWVFGDPYTFLTNSASFSQAFALLRRTNFLPTVESLKDTNLVNPGNASANKIQGPNYGRWKGSLTVWSSNVDLTPWGTPKFNLADLTDTTLYRQPSNAMAALVSYLRTNGMTNLFPAGMTLARKYGGGDINSTNPNNHGDLVLQQISANLMSAVGRPVLLTNSNTIGGDYQRPNPATSYLRHRNLMPTSVASHYLGPYLNQVRARVDWRIVPIGTTTNVQGRLAIWVSVMNPSTKIFNNWSVSVQPRKWKFATEPKSGQGFEGAAAQVLKPTYGDPLANFTTGRVDGGKTAVIGPAWEIGTTGPQILNASWPLGSVFEETIPTIPAKSFYNIFFYNIISYDLAGCKEPISEIIVSKAYVMLDQVCLYAGPRTDRTLLRDWLTHDDLAQINNFKTALDVGQFDFDNRSDGMNSNNPVPINAGAAFLPLTTNDFTPQNSHGVQKIDPQVRFPLCFWNTNLTATAFNMGLLRPGGFPDTVKVWTRNNSVSYNDTSGSVTGIPYLWPDPAPGVVLVNNHPHFSPGYYPENGIKSVAQLGAIHTGLPWRTLRFQPQPRVEMLAANGATNSPPDWILLDAFTATNGTQARTMVNLNGFPMAFGGPATNSDSKISTRAISLACLMGGAARSADGASISNGVPASLAGASSAYTNLNIMASNLAAGLTVGLTNPKAWWTNSLRTSSAWGDFRSDTSQIAKFPTNGFLFSGEILEMPGIAENTNTVSTYGEDVIEGRLRSFLDLCTTRSDTFTVWSAGQGLAVNTNRSNRTNVMAEVRKQTVFQRIPMLNPARTAVTNYQIKILHTRNHLVE